MFRSKQYFISEPDDDVSGHEEALVDSSGLNSKIESPVRRGFFSVFYVIIFSLAALVIVKSFQLQVVSGEYHASIAERNSYVKYYTAALRGMIESADGVALADNRPILDLLAFTSKVDYDELTAERTGRLAEIIDRPAEYVESLFESNRDKSVFVIARDIGREAAIKIDKLGIGGVYIINNVGREYRGGEAFSHILGYTSEAGPGEIEDGFYVPSDLIGRLGVEEYYEPYLAGRRGVIYFGGAESVIIEEPTVGDKIRLTVESEVQNKLYESLDGVLRSQGLRRGAAVVQDARTGSILAMVSFPSYDNNLFSKNFMPESAGRIKQILDDPARPMFNRVVGGRYSPGSTIKPLMAMAALKEGTIDTSTIIYSSGAIYVPSEVDPNVVYTFRDWKVHGWSDVFKSIADSVDVFFYAVGGGYDNIKGLGIDKIHEYFTGAHADKKLGIDLPGEARGFVPSRDWKKKVKGENWYKGDTYNVSIGQGDLSVTPLWINSYVGAIANGGSIMKPYVVKDVEKASEVIEINRPEILAKLDFSADTIDIVKQGMRRAVEDGTAKLLSSVPVPLAAKTGTAQAPGGTLNSLLSVFGPYDNPGVVVTIVVENVGDEQGLALRVAKSFLEWYFTRNN